MSDTLIETRPPLPPFTLESATKKVRGATPPAAVTVWLKAEPVVPAGSVTGESVAEQDRVVASLRERAQSLVDDVRRLQDLARREGHVLKGEQARSDDAG